MSTIYKWKQKKLLKTKKWNAFLFSGSDCQKTIFLGKNNFSTSTERIIYIPNVTYPYIIFVKLQKFRKIVTSVSLGMDFIPLLLI